MLEQGLEDPRLSREQSESLTPYVRRVVQTRSSRCTTDVARNHLPGRSLKNRDFVGVRNQDVGWEGELYRISICWVMLLAASGLQVVDGREKGCSHVQRRLLSPRPRASTVQCATLCDRILGDAHDVTQYSSPLISFQAGLASTSQGIEYGTGHDRLPLLALNLSLHNTYPSAGPFHVTMRMCEVVCRVS